MTLSELQQKAYSELPNYKIMGGGKIVAIYFSSNNLYWPDTAECFQQTVIEKDRYEWTRLKIKRASKHIFVRDVYKEWYITGINKSTSSISALYELLKKETEGAYEIIIVGSSAGGYAATLFGTWLKADIIFNFNGQWELNTTIKKNGYGRLESLRATHGEYYDIVDKVSDTTNVFHFISCKSVWDVEQLKHSQHLNVNRIRFTTSHHGIPFLKVALPVVLNMNKEQLLGLSGKTYNPILFTIRCVGTIKTIQGLYKQIKTKLNKHR